MRKKPINKAVLGKKTIVELPKPKGWWKRLLDRFKNKHKSIPQNHENTKNRQTKIQ